MAKINTRVLVSGADYFDDGFAINAYMDEKVPVDIEKAKSEHRAIVDCFKQAGIEVIQVDAPKGCQDGVYTANWALTRGNKAVMSNLPNKRVAEEPYAEAILSRMGYQVIKLPRDIHFSGQGDALPCGNRLFVGTGYRTSPEAHIELSKHLGFEIIPVQTIPELDQYNQPVINPVSGWPDSFFYDLDLAIAIIKPDLIAWCPDAFVPQSQELIRSLTDIDKIEVSYDEAVKASACNLVSTGETVILGDRAPELKANLEARGLKTLTPSVSELQKGGGFIRCISLSLQNT